MRIVALADIHGSYKKVNDILARERGYDAIIIGGDVTTNGSPREAEDAIRLFLSHGKPLFVVAGNMDPSVLDQTFETMGVSINARGTVLGDVGFFGVSGSPVTPMRTPNEISEEEILSRAEAGWARVQSARWKIFVPHAPPRGTSVDRVFIGTHVGSTAVRSFIEDRQPDVVVCGHIHEARGRDTIGKTQIVNCGPAGRGCYAVIELGTDVDVQLKG
jgi:Icc-related predicted phosphoesterase